MKRILASLFIIAFVLGCQQRASKKEAEITAFVKNWNALHTQLKAPFLRTDYMDVVQYYGVERTHFQVAQHKKMVFEKFPKYVQTIKNDAITITKEGPSFLVVFDKEVQYADQKGTYESYLLLTRSNSKYKILSEGVANDGSYLNIPIFPNDLDKRLSASENRQLFGDFNGDDLSDFAYVASPEVLTKPDKNNPNVIATCDGPCDSIIHFSATDLEIITVENAYTSQLENLKDLDGDGADELGFWDIKPNEKTLYIFSPATGKLLITPLFINTKAHKNLKLIDVIKKTGLQKITVTQSILKDNKWVLESEVIRFDE